ncbi:uncharacterized protein E0L32_007813 [Thyridium curvatum]|uniref:Uncharacterized protein n=1 Tax=Thyridium curvatum TaxID=1093900 RepID=A0A507AY64_9PEZI|nr:uncharacterized protein E0L32_007813 [Thyridium curvatum]TPX11394.1 hypothetical protein E0L32_007813 [Thyridium curvatum]
MQNREHMWTPLAEELGLHWQDAEFLHQQSHKKACNQARLLHRNSLPTQIPIKAHGKVSLAPQPVPLQLPFELAPQPVMARPSLQPELAPARSPPLQLPFELAPQPVMVRPSLRPELAPARSPPQQVPLEFTRLPTMMPPSSQQGVALAGVVPLGRGHPTHIEPLQLAPLQTRDAVKKNLWKVKHAKLIAEARPVNIDRQRHEADVLLPMSRVMGNVDVAAGQEEEPVQPGGGPVLAGPRIAFYGNVDPAQFPPIAEESRDARSAQRIAAGRASHLEVGHKNHMMRQCGILYA